MEPNDDQENIPPASSKSTDRAVDKEIPNDYIDADITQLNVATESFDYSKVYNNIKDKSE